MHKHVIIEVIYNTKASYWKCGSYFYLARILFTNFSRTIRTKRLHLDPQISRCVCFNFLYLCCPLVNQWQVFCTYCKPSGVVASVDSVWTALCFSNSVLGGKMAPSWLQYAGCGAVVDSDSARKHTEIAQRKHKEMCSFVGKRAKCFTVAMRFYIVKRGCGWERLISTSQLVKC